ncbi:MAG: ABC transporter ATP-binding protein [Puniceicoccaceae bacterium]
MSVQDAPSTPAVSTLRLSKSFGDTVEALRDVDLTIAKGEFVALIGPSGCGKTTLLRILSGLEQPSSGRINIFGNTPEEACRRSAIGVAFQQPALVDSRTARQNVRLTLEITGTTPNHTIEDLLERFGLGNFMDSYPHELSGGMKQRVNIACALIHDPQLLLLDEPFGALDELTREQLGGWLSGILQAEGQTAVLVTHSVDEAVLLADRIVILSPRPGRISEIVSVPFPQPRSRSIRQDRAFLDLVSVVRQKLYRITEEAQ